MAKRYETTLDHQSNVIHKRNTVQPWRVYQTQNSHWLWQCQHSSADLPLEWSEHRKSALCEINENAFSLLTIVDVLKPFP